MESKLYKLEIKFSEVKTRREIDHQSLLLFINCGNISNCLKYQTNNTLSLPNFSSESVLELRLEQNENIIATGSTIIGKLCEKTLTGDYNKWIKFESTCPGEPNIKVKIQGNLRNPRRASPVKQRPGYLNGSPQKNKIKCLYIRKLNCAEEREKEIQGVIQKVKARMELNYGELIEDGIKSPVQAGRSPARSPLRKRTLEKFSEFDLELSSRFDIIMEHMSSNEPHLLRYVCIALGERIKVMRTQADEYASIFGVLATFQDPIKDLNNSLVETKEQIQREDRKMLELEKKIEQEMKDIDEECKISEEKISQLKGDIENIKEQYEEVRKSNELLSFEGSLEEEKAEINDLLHNLENIDKNREELLAESEKILEKYDDNSLDIERSKVLDEKFQYLAQLQSKNSIFDHLTIENLQLNGEIALLSAQLLAEDDAKVRMSEIESNKETFSTASGCLKEELLRLSELRENSISEGLKISRKLEIDVKDIEKNCKVIAGELEDKENDSKTKAEYLKKMNIANDEAKNWIKKDEDEFQEKHENFLEKYEADKNAKDLLVKELGFFADLTLMHVSSSVIEERIHKKLEEILEEKDHQRHSMQRIIITTKKSLVSSPRKENISEASFSNK